MRKIFFMVMLGILFHFALVQQTNADNMSDYKNSFEIVSSKVNFSQNENCSYITCIGVIKNRTYDVWEDFVIEVTYFDTNGELIDTETDHLYSNVLQAKDSMTFRIRTSADRGESEYKSHKLRITSAQKRADYSEGHNEYYNQNEDSYFWMSIITSWGPVVLLIAVWFFFMYWSLFKKKSPQMQTIELLKTQLDLLENNNTFMERIAIAIENKQK